MTTQAADTLHTPLFQHSTWSDMDKIHAIFAKLRRDAPVHYGSVEGFDDFWHITKHSDIFEIESKQAIFLNEPRSVLLSEEREAAISALTGGSIHLIRSLVAMDKPDHPKMRILTQAWFMPSNLKKLDREIKAIAELSIDRLANSAPDCDFASAVAVWYPLRVVMSVLGVPSEDEPRMLKLTQELFGANDPDLKRESVVEKKNPIGSIVETFMDFQRYFKAIIEDRRANPKDDIASIIANAQIDGQPISDRDAIGYYIIIATAGHDTTSYSIVEAVNQLAKSPDLFQRLKDDPETIAPLITEEALRFASPVRHFIRTAAEDYELRGKNIRKGDSLILWYLSGSRDEDIFDNPDTFDIDRNQRVRHAAFGHGAHMCLGMYLARQEISTLLKAIAKRVKSIELTAPPKYAHANFVGGIKHLPVKVEMQAT